MEMMITFPIKEMYIKLITKHYISHKRLPKNKWQTIFRNVNYYNILNCDLVSYFKTKTYHTHFVSGSRAGNVTVCVCIHISVSKIPE